MVRNRTEQQLAARAENERKRREKLRNDPTYKEKNKKRAQKNRDKNVGRVRDEAWRANKRERDRINKRNSRARLREEAKAKKAAQLPEGAGQADKEKPAVSTAPTESGAPRQGSPAMEEEPSPETLLLGEGAGPTGAELPTTSASNAATRIASGTAMEMKGKKNQEEQDYSHASYKGETPLSGKEPNPFKKRSLAAVLAAIEKQDKWEMSEPAQGGKGKSKERALNFKKKYLSRYDRETNNSNHTRMTYGQVFRANRRCRVPRKAMASVGDTKYERVSRKEASSIISSSQTSQKGADTSHTAFNVTQGRQCSSIRMAVIAEEEVGPNKDSELATGFVTNERTPGKSPKQVLMAKKTSTETLQSTPGQLNRAQRRGRRTKASLSTLQITRCARRTRSSLRQPALSDMDKAREEMMELGVATLKSGKVPFMNTLGLRRSARCSISANGRV